MRFVRWSKSAGVFTRKLRHPELAIGELDGAMLPLFSVEQRALPWSPVARVTRRPQEAFRRAVQQYQKVRGPGKITPEELYALAYIVASSGPKGAFRMLPPDQPLPSAEGKVHVMSLQQDEPEPPKKKKYRVTLPEGLARVAIP